jgi:hypothetical protein
MLLNVNGESQYGQILIPLVTVRFHLCLKHCYKKTHSFVYVHVNRNKQDIHQYVLKLELIVLYLIPMGLLKDSKYFNKLIFSFNIKLYLLLKIDQHHRNKINDFQYIQ